LARATIAIVGSETLAGRDVQFIDGNEDPAVILATVQSLRVHVADYDDECRKRFLEKFHYRANCIKLAEILENTFVNTPSRATARGCEAVDHV